MIAIGRATYMRIRTLIIMIFAFLTLVISGCGSGGSSGSSSGGGNGDPSEVWKDVENLSVGNFTSSTTFSKDSTGTLSVSGDWEISSQGYTISCPFTNGTATITKTTLTINGSGVAKATGGNLAGVQNPTFTISGNATYNVGVPSGSVTITFANNVIPAFTVGWNPTKQSGSGVTYVAPVGNYSGTFSGGDTGTWQFTLDQGGNINGTITSSNYNKTAYLFGTQQMDGSITLQDSLDSSTIYTGSINSISGYVSGTWENPNPHINTSGSFTGSRK